MILVKVITRSFINDSDMKKYINELNEIKSLKLVYIDGYGSIPNPTPNNASIIYTIRYDQRTYNVTVYYNLSPSNFIDHMLIRRIRYNRLDEIKYMKFYKYGFNTLTDTVSYIKLTYPDHNITKPKIYNNDFRIDVISRVTNYHIIFIRFDNCVYSFDSM